MSVSLVLKFGDFFSVVALVWEVRLTQAIHVILWQELLQRSLELLHWGFEKFDVINVSIYRVTRQQGNQARAHKQARS